MKADRGLKMDHVVKHIYLALLGTRYNLIFISTLLESKRALKELIQRRLEIEDLNE